MEGTHDNDDEKLTFITLSAATRNVTRYLGLDEKKDEHADKESNSDAKKKALDHLDFVNLRLRELARFEDRTRGRK